jgi:nucleoside-diphosphate-sugar epimerase/pimeloyl-ACP methyl ester carboxylesterase
MRSEAGAILLTGATGFIGSNLAAQILATESAYLFCLVRGNGDNLQKRLVDAVSAAAKTAGNWRKIQPQLARLVAIPGDLTRDSLLTSLGADRKLADANIAEVWHCAASLCFEEHRRAEIFRHNVAGTERVLKLAVELRARAFRHLSTAYVAGKGQGKIPESPYDASVPCNNLYEESKRLAEDRVLAAERCGGMSVTIFRPSIVIGNSRTFQATTESGFYGFLAGLFVFADEVEDKVPGYLARNPLRVLSEKSTALNLIPVDLLVSEALAIARNPPDGRTIFHLTNPFPVRIEQVRRSVLGPLGRTCVLRFDLVTDESELRPLDSLFHNRFRFYSSYLINNKIFERGRDATPPPQFQLTEDALTNYAERFLLWYRARQKFNARKRARDLQGLQTITVRCRHNEPLTYHRGGRGPVVALINAYGVSLRFWEHVITEFIPNYRILTWECRGCSANGADRAYGVVEHAEDLKEILDREGADRAHLVAWCTGPKVALEFHHRYPQATASMTFITPSLAPLENEDLSTHYDLVLGKVARMVCRRPEMASVFLRALSGILTKTSSGNTTEQPEVVDLLGLIGKRYRNMVIGPFLNERVIENYSRMIVEFQEHRVDSLLAGARLPTMAISAENDRIAHPRCSQVIATKMPVARCVTLAGASHWCLLEEGNRIVDEIGSFLEDVPRVSRSVT